MTYTCRMFHSSSKDDAARSSALLDLKIHITPGRNRGNFTSSGPGRECLLAALFSTRARTPRTDSASHRQPRPEVVLRPARTSSHHEGPLFDCSGCYAFPGACLLVCLGGGAAAFPSSNAPVPTGDLPLSTTTPLASPQSFSFPLLPDPPTPLPPGRTILNDGESTHQYACAG